MKNLKKLLQNKYLVFVSRILVGGIFTYAGIIKLSEPIEDFISIGHQWDIIGDPMLTWFITALPWVELVFGVMLIIGAFTRVSSAVIGLMMVSFLIAIGINMARGRTLEDCGCFGSAFHFGDTFAQLLWRDVVLMILTLIALFAKESWLSVDGYFKGTTPEQGAPLDSK